MYEWLTQTLTALLLSDMHIIESYGIIIFFYYMNQ